MGLLFQSSCSVAPASEADTQALGTEPAGTETVAEEVVGADIKLLDAAPQASEWPASGADTLIRGDYLFRNQRLMDSNCYFSLVMQSDGNLVTYAAGWWPMWATGSAGGQYAFAVFQSDNNFVVYNSGGYASWATNTVSRGGSTVVQQGDANLVMYGNGAAIWASNISVSGAYNCGPDGRAPNGFYGEKTRVWNNVDLWGDDLPGGASQQNRYNFCGALCADRADCQAFTWYNGWCYLKGGPGAAYTLAGAVSGRKMAFN